MRVLQQDETGLHFVLETAVFHTDANGQLQLDGLDATLTTPGAPILPYYTTFIALPPEAEVSIRVETGRVINRQAPDSLAIAPEPELAYANDAQDPAFPDTPVPGAFTDWVIDADYEAGTWYPTAVYELSAPIYYRDLRLVQLKLFPLRHHATQNRIEQITDIRVSLTYSGGDLSRVQPLSGGETTLQSLRQSVLNFEQGLAWRHLPQNLQELPGPGLPIGLDTYKIQVDTDGLYEISGAELAAAGMNLSQVDPNTIEMMHRGQPVAYQFVGDPNDGFQADDAIRFFGAAFTGSRLETQFIGDNVYWLWAGGAPSPISQRANAAGQGQPILTTFRTTITREPEWVHHSSWTNRWDEYPNEPDAWYWELVTQNTTILTRNYTIELPHPALTGSDLYYEVELLPRETHTAPTNFLYDVRATINNYHLQGQVTWQRLRNINLTGTQPITTLVNGSNTASVIFATDPTASAGNPRVFLNRISIEYDRLLTADNDQLLFDKQNSPGVQQFLVNNFSGNNPEQILVWDISDPLHPEQINLTAGDISGSGPYTYTFTSEAGENGRYLATTLANAQSVKQISQYIPQSLEPAAGADWVAISHNLFLTEATRLAAHRTNPQFGGLATHIVNIEDLINQYGYGLPLPEAIRHYLGYALANWPTPPGYVVLVGGGTVNPRNLACQPTLCRPQWDATQPNFVLTDIVFKDRFQGAIPSDQTLATLSGDDPLADMAIGRLVANTPEEANNIVSKIIQHDQNQLTPTDPQRHLLFVADNADAGGNFCQENSNAGAKLPPSFLQSHVCLDEATEADTDRLRSEMKAHIDTEGVNILNYRGHGGVQFWAGPPIFNVNPLSSGYAGQVYITSTTPISGFWANVGQPLIIISADCLDGHFGFPGEPAVSRTFMAMPDVGTAAHWSSTGLGFTFEHTILVDALYAGAFELGLTALGDAINHAKFVYHSAGQHPSELYSFLLQGDPAMQLYRPDLSLEKSSPQSSAPLYTGDEVTFHLTVQNNGIFASNIILTDHLPIGLQYQTYTASVPLDLTIQGNDLIFTFDDPLAWGERAAITLTTIITSGVDGLVTNHALISSGGWDSDPSDNTDSVSLLIRDSDVRLEKSSPQSNTPLYPGDNAIFYLNIQNSSVYSDSIILTDTLPAGLAYQAHSASVPVSLTVAGADLVFTLLEPLAPGAGAMVTLTTAVTPNAAGLLTNTATVQGAGGDTDIASATVLVYHLNMRLEKSSPQSATPLNRDEEAMFQLTIHNDGINAGSIHLTDSLPSGLQFQAYSASVPVSLTISGGELLFTLLDPLNGGTSATITITTRVTGDVTGSITNTAIIESPDWPLNPATREASASLVILPYLTELYLPVILKP